MRKLLSSAVPAPEDEPGLRDVIGPAMVWGDRRRRLEWSLAGAAALAVIAVGAGVATLGGSSRDGNASPGGGGSPKGVASSSPTTSGVLPCLLPGGQTGQPGSDYCTLQAEVQGGFYVEFAKGVAPLIQADLPRGFTVATTDSRWLVLSGPGGKNYLFPGLAENDAVKPGVTVGSAPSMGQSAQWADGSGANGTRLVIDVSISDPVGNPTAKGPLLTDDQLRTILNDPAIQKYAAEQNKRWEEINRRFQQYLPPSPTGSIVSPPPSHPSASTSWTSPSGSMVPPPTSGSWSCVMPPSAGSSSSGAPTAASSPSCPPSSWPSSPASWTSSVPPSTTFTSMPVPTGNHS